MSKSATSPNLNTLETRVSQARLLKQRVIGSCIFVQSIILYVAAMLWFGGYREKAEIWLVITTFMVLVTYAYARLKSPQGIDETNVKSYLRGHVIVSCMTGAIWGAFAVYQLDWASEFTLFIACSIVATITIGGMLPGATYRPGFIALSTFMIIPLGVYVTISGHGPLRIVGVGLLIFYAFGLVSSARAQENTRVGISARRERELTTQIVSQNETIQKAHADKTRFLAATSHDLAQPLHAQGYFIQALRKALKSAEQIDLLDKIETSWRAQIQLLQGLGDITRLDTGAIIPKPHLVNPLADMQNLVAEFDQSIAAKSLRLNTDFAPIILHTDPVLLIRILRNILANAIKFTPENGQIDFIMKRNANHVEISIRDTGIGIPQNKHDAVFDEYVQLENHHRDREQGLGLGLSIVRRLTELLDIDMQFNSKPGKGTYIVLTLPNQATHSLSLMQTTTETSDFENAPLVILVDDEKAIRESMSTLLTNWGCKIMCASTGTEAIALLNETDDLPALLIVDKRLAHGENGITLIEKLREEVNETTPAILITGDLTGFDDLVSDPNIHLMTKPVEPQNIKAAIAKILNR